MSEIGPGATLADGRYRLERRLGVGGMASVWLGTDDRLRRPVAVKVISDTLAADESYLRRFEREARTAAALSHPNLVRVFDFAADGQRPFLVMEYIEGRTLADALEEADASIDAESLARELLDALAHVHDGGIVHRDVKPANVLIGEDGRARLTDFGIAQPEDATRLTQTGNVIGTMRYLAPEVAAGEPATPRSDLYSFGVVLRECTGQAPSRSVGRLLQQLTADNPAGRPRSARDALSVLETRPQTAETTPLAASAEAPRPPTQSAQPTTPLATDSGQGVARRRALGRQLHIEGATLKALLAAGALLLLLLILVTAGGGGGGEPPRGDRLPLAPRDAPLSEQLDALDHGVREAAR